MAPFTRKDAPGEDSSRTRNLFCQPVCSKMRWGLAESGLYPDDAFQGAPASRQYPALFPKRPGESLVAVSEFS